MDEKIDFDKDQQKRRRSQRLAITIAVRWIRRGSTVDLPAEGFIVNTQNLDENGFFLRSEDVEPVGSELDLEIMMEDEKEYKVKGKVAWIADPHKHPFYYPGMGVEFVELDETARRAISSYVNHKISNYYDAKELTEMYLVLKEMAGRLLEIEEKHPRAERFRKTIENAVREIDDVAHIINKEVWEVRNL
ncbi:MAG: PilZ domain-containing protein [Candidatus Omnitrophica bacterium]|nr:PilZ domain-containing protein [Candidatus Omnitrophota bacterium]